MAKRKLSKSERKEQRLRKARQWLTTYQGTPKKMVKHYKERFHVDTTCALNDLREIGVEFTQEYLEAVKQAEKNRLEQLRRKREQKALAEMASMYEYSDDRFAFIVDTTPGGAPFGLTWEDVGIDPELPYETKVQLWLSQSTGEDLCPDAEDELPFD